MFHLNSKFIFNFMLGLCGEACRSPSSGWTLSRCLWMAKDFHASDFASGFGNFNVDFSKELLQLFEFKFELGFHKVVSGLEGFYLFAGG